MRAKTIHQGKPLPASDQERDFNSRQPFDCVSEALHKERQRLVAFLNTLFDKELGNKVALTDNGKEVRQQGIWPTHGRLLGMFKKEIELNQILMRELTSDDVARQIIGQLSDIEKELLEAQTIYGFKIIRLQDGNLDRLWIYEP